MINFKMRKKENLFLKTLSIEIFIGMKRNKIDLYGIIEKIDF